MRDAIEAIGYAEDYHDDPTRRAYLRGKSAGFVAFLRLKAQHSLLDLFRSLHNVEAILLRWLRREYLDHEIAELPIEFMNWARERVARKSPQ